MKYKPEVFKNAINHLRIHNNYVGYSNPESPFSCDCIGYSVRALNVSKRKYVNLYSSFFKDENSPEFDYFGWFDKSEPGQAKFEREIALELMYWITKDLNKKAKVSKKKSDK